MSLSIIGEKHYWGEAALTATFLINRLPSKILDFHSPIQLLKRFFPDLHILSGWKPKVSGCVAFVHIHGPHRSKLDPRALKCIFVGYSSTQKGYRCYHPPTKRFFISADVTFAENLSYFSNNQGIQNQSTTRSASFSSRPLAQFF